MKTVNYMLLPGSNTSHRVIGILPGQHAQIVPDQFQAWHAEEDNLEWLGIEEAQPNLMDPYTEFQYNETAGVIVEWERTYGHLILVGHEDTAQGKRNGKSDPGPPWAWDRLGTAIEAVRAAL